MPVLQGLNRMDIDNTQQEATPGENTVRSQLPNPINFDERSLAKLLKTRFSGEEEKQKQQVEENTEPESADAESQAEDAEPTAEQTEPQAESPEEVLSDSQDEDESLGVRKRIDKLTRQKKEALEKAETLERELNDVKAKLEQGQAERPVAVANQADPFADVWDVAKLNDEWTKARNLKRWCEDNIDGCEIEGKEYSSDEVKQIKRRVEDAIDMHIPNRARFLNNYNQIKPVAETLYPWWKNRASAEYTAAQQVMRQLPQIQALPEYQVLIGDFIEGRRVRMEREASKGKSQLNRATTKAPSQPGRPTAAPVKKDAAKASLQVAKSQFRKSGSTSELAQVLKRIL